MNEFFNQYLAGNKVIRVAFTATFVFLALFLLAATISTFKGIGRTGFPATDTITVTGNGEAAMAPDVAHVSFTVQNTAATVAEAQEATTKQTDKAIDFVGEKVQEKDIKTLSYNISPQYSYQGPCYAGGLCPSYMSPKITGYQVSQTIRVTVRDLSAVGELLGGLGGLEVQNISGPDFALDDKMAGYNAARADAIDEAKEQARVLAKQLGVKLGKIVSYNESSGGSPYPMMGYAMGGDFAMESKAASAPNVPAGENTYNATVSITYEIR